MTCAQVRSLLAERSLGAMREADPGVDRHLSWCAACRKEARDLDAAAAGLVYALAPESPPTELEDRVVGAVAALASGRHPSVHRRGRMVIAATVAAMLAVAGLGFGAVMAGRAARFKDQAATSKVASQNAISLFRQLLQSAEFRDPRNSVEMGQLSPVGGGPASGVALTLLSPSSPDMSMVTVSALKIDPRRLPLAVYLVGPHRHVRVGSIEKLDSGGSATVAMQVVSDLSFFDHVVVRDAAGHAVLRGSLAKRPLQSPTPTP